MKKTINPLVSVILPAYNSANFIKGTLDCLFAQTYNPMELIVINDGSTDLTLDVLKGFSDTGKIILLDQKNKGVAAARNAGISIARGEYIAFIDSDDYWFEEKISTQVAYLELHPEIGAVYAAWHRWNANQNGLFPSPLSLAPKLTNLDIDESLSGWLYNQLLLDCVIHTSSIMIRSSILKEIGVFDTTLAIGEDYDLWLRLSRVTKIDKLATPLSLYKIHAESLTNKKPLDICCGAMVIERAIKKWGYIGQDGTETSKQKMRSILANMYFDFAYNHYRNGNMKIGLNSILKALSYNVVSRGSWVYLLIISISIIRQKILN